MISDRSVRSLRELRGRTAALAEVLDSETVRLHVQVLDDVLNDIAGHTPVGVMECAVTVEVAPDLSWRAAGAGPGDDAAKAAVMSLDLSNGSTLHSVRVRVPVTRG